MSTELSRLIEGQLEQLHRLLAEHRDGISRIMRSSPALGSMEPAESRLMPDRLKDEVLQLTKA